MPVSKNRKKHKKKLNARKTEIAQAKNRQKKLFEQYYQQIMQMKENGPLAGTPDAIIPVTDADMGDEAEYGVYPVTENVAEEIIADFVEHNDSGPSQD